ncbi:hypothetical protein GCM10023116_46770 [Kistimonas scapharcae]|uniref:Uncharacterized protein n=1 Tax=Kistimonas scapharcae TaxID=1036133 RepID=A0ABP8V846_9GAMM
MPDKSNNTPLSFADLIGRPTPFKAWTGFLPDGRPYRLHDLPAAVMDDVHQAAANGKAGPRFCARIGAWAMLGEEPTEEQVESLLRTQGTDTILHIYKDALTRAGLHEEAVDEAKKD